MRTRTLVLFLLLVFAAKKVDAATWYFGQGPGDSDANSCASAQTDANGSRKATPQGALACVGYSAGAGANDVVEGRAGTYQQALPVGGHATDQFPSGTSWAAPFTLRCRANEVCVLKGSGERNIWISNAQDMYAIIEGFTLDGINLSNDQFRIGTSTTTARFVRFIGNEIINTEMENAIYIGAPQAGQDDGIEILNNRIHGGAFFTTANAAGRNHAMYITGRGTLIEGNELFDLTGFGVHIYCSEGGVTVCTNIIVRNNKIYNFGTDTPTVAGILSRANGGGANQIYNNEVFNAQGRDNDGAIGIETNSVGDKLYSNLVYSMTWMGITSSGSGHEVKNNLVHNIPGAADQITGSGATRSNNLCGQAHANCAFNGNPLFVNAAIGDFRVQSGSPAIGNGATLGSPWNVDMTGISRPQATGYDIGPHEFTSVVTSYVDVLLGSACSGNYSVVSRNCSGSDGDAYPASQINTAIQASAGGRVINIREGTYTTSINDASITWPTTSFSSRLIIQAYSNETVTINGSGGPAFNQVQSGTSYTTFKKLNFNCTGGYNECIGLQGHHLRFENVSVNGNKSTTACNLIIINPTSHHHEFVDSEFQGSGIDTRCGGGIGVGYLFYILGPDNLIERSKLHDAGHYAIHNYEHDPSPSRNVYRFNRIYNNCQVASGGGSQVLLGAGDDVQAYSNLIYDPADPNCSGVEIGNGATNAKVFENTITGGHFSAVAHGQQTGGVVRNNIFFNNNQDIWDAGFGSTVTASNNRGDSAGAGISTTTNPRFADAPNKDFRLCTDIGVPHASCPGASAMIDAGFALGAPFNFGFDGTLRPQGSGWDIGAFESGGGTPPPPPTCPATPALVAKYGLDGNATDASANGNNGTLGAGITWGAGKYGQAASFTGQGAISAAATNPLFLCTGYTLAGWIKPADTPTGFVAVIVKNYRYFLYSSSSGYCAPGAPLGGYEQGGHATACYNTGFTAGVWSHFALTYDGTILRMYINGTQVTSQAATAVLDDSIGTLQIGGSQYDEYFNGDIDEVWIFNCALGATVANPSCSPAGAPQTIASLMNTAIGSPSTPIVIGVGGGTTVNVGPGTTVNIGLVH